MITKWLNDTQQIKNISHFKNIIKLHIYKNKKEDSNVYT